MKCVGVARVRDLLEYDPATGVFKWRVSRCRVTKGQQAGGLDSKGYVVIRVDGRKYPAHRLAWLMMTGEWPIDLIDHRDGSRANNVFDNLRSVDRVTNAQNLRRGHKDSRSGGLLGAHWCSHSRKWLSQIRPRGGNSIYLGRFESAEQAHIAHIDAKRRLHPGNTL